jgi:flagellar biosynthesis GTPase FlhF
LWSESRPQTTNRQSSRAPAPKVEPKGIDEYDPTQTRLRKLEREMQEIRALVQTMHAYIANGAAPAPTAEGETEPPVIAATLDEHPLLRPLMAAGVEQEVVQELLRRVPRLPHNAAVDALRRTLSARIPIGGALPRESRHRQVAVLVGPTGVGKTTTIAKLAAIHALDYGRKVALLSLDTYRIGAIQQLRTYAELMNLPLLTATNTDEVADALEQFAGYDLVLIDTIGRGQRDEEHLQEMRQALTARKGSRLLDAERDRRQRNAAGRCPTVQPLRAGRNYPHQARRGSARWKLYQSRPTPRPAVRLLHDGTARARRHHPCRRARAHLRRTARHHRMRHRPQTP